MDKVASLAPNVVIWGVYLLIKKDKDNEKRFKGITQISQTDGL